MWVDLERVFICTGGGSMYVWTLKELRKTRTKLWFKQTAGSCNKPVSKDSSATQICTDSGLQGQLHNVSSSSQNNFIQRLKPKGFVSEREGKIMYTSTKPGKLQNTVNVKTNGQPPELKHEVNPVGTQNMSHYP